MSEGDIAEPLRGGTGVGPDPVLPAAQKQVSFNRTELQAILNLYGRKVAEGEWRDYAIDFPGRQGRVLHLPARTSEVPLLPDREGSEARQEAGAYSVVVSSGLILKRGPELDRVLACSTRS